MATYLVTREGAAEDELPRIIECRTKQQAINFVAGDMFSAEPVSTKTAMAFAAQGVELEEVNSEDASAEGEG